MALITWSLGANYYPEEVAGIAPGAAYALGLASALLLFASILLHELGHALHFANMSRALPFEFRWLGDNSVTEGYAMLFDHRLKDRGFVIYPGKLTVADSFRIGCIGRIGATEINGALSAVREVLTEMGVTHCGRRSVA